MSHLFKIPVMGGFWGAKIVKSEHNLKNIRKSSKHNLNNNFVGNLIISYLRGFQTQETCNSFLVFF